MTQELCFCDFNNQCTIHNISKQRVREAIEKWIHPAPEEVTLSLKGRSYFEAVAQAMKKELGL